MPEYRFELDENRANELLEKNSEIAFESKFTFLHEHKGWRKGKLHLILGIAGGGKSTLMRSALFDLFDAGMTLSTACVWLSEESSDDLLMGLARTKSKIGSNTLNIFSEIDAGEHQLTPLYLEEYLKQLMPQVFIFDNLTTSQMYEGKTPREQLAFVKALKRISHQLGIPFILIAHTGTEVTEGCNRMINMNDIRGTKNAINLVEYIYILQRITTESYIHPTIRVAKSRGHVIENDIHKLVFNPDKIVYSKSYIFPFDEFKEVFKARRTL